MGAQERFQCLEELQNVLGPACVGWVYGRIEKGRDDDAMHGVRTIGGNGTLQSPENRHEGRFTGGHDWDEGHVGNGRVCEALGKVECMAEGRRLVRVLFTSGSRRGNYVY